MLIVTEIEKVNFVLKYLAKKDENPKMLNIGIMIILICK
ncbi:MAG: pyruvate phosphate dikinase [Rickettsia aeschlimannii]